MSWRLWYTYRRDVVCYCHLRLTSRCRHPDPGQDLIPLQRLLVFAHSRDPHPAINLWCQVPFTKSKTIFQIEMYCMQCFWKANILKMEPSMIKICELLWKLWSFRSCFLILPPGALTLQCIEGVMKRDVSKHWCTFQWCASRGWFIAHENWTPCFRQFGNFTRQKLLLYTFMGQKHTFPVQLNHVNLTVGPQGHRTLHNLIIYRTMGLSEHRYPYNTFGISSFRNKHFRTIESSEYRTFEL